MTLHHRIRFLLLKGMPSIFLFFIWLMSGQDPKRTGGSHEQLWSVFICWIICHLRKKGNGQKRSFSLVKRWLKELDIKKARFDKYRCEICFEGRGAEGRIKIGKPNEGDQENLKKYKDHQSQYENQFEKVKTDNNKK
jgi:hypothetical protein